MIRVCALDDRKKRWRREGRDERMEQAMRIETEIVQEFTGRYLKVTAEGKTADFGEKVLKYNRIDGILGAEVQQIDNKPQYVYAIGNGIPFSDYLKRGIFSAEDIKFFMRRIIHLIGLAKEYFLDERDMMLTGDCMFFDELENKLLVAYLDGYQHDVGKGISGILEICMDHMNHQDKELVFLVYGLHKISKEANFCLSRLTEVLGGQQPIKQTGDRTGEVRRREAVMICERPKVPSEAGRKKEASFTIGPPWKRTVFFGKAAGYLAAGIFVFVSAVYSGVLNGENGGLDIQKSAVLAVFLIVLEWCMIGKLRGGDVQHKKEDDTEIWNDQTEKLIETDLDQTVVLVDQRPQTIYLNLIPKDWQREEIKIRKTPFFIGKNNEKSDAVITAGEISRVHAKIVVEEDGVFVIDQESTNGTYVNGKQLVPWERRKVCADDEIAFSSVFYRVETES